MVQGELIRDAGRLEDLRGRWDALAEAAGRPYCAPGWMLSWWRHAAPPGARLCVAAAWEEEALVGLAPLWGERRAGVEWLRPLAADVAHRTEPLSRPGDEARVAPALACAIAGTQPEPDVVALEGLGPNSPWPSLLAAGWPGTRRPQLRAEREVPAPQVTLGPDGYDAWLARKSSNFRGQARRLRRKAEAAGARFVRIGEVEELEPALRELARLHHARWEPKGGSAALDERVEAMLRAAAEDLAPRGRLWIWAIEAAGRTVSSHLFVAAGDQVVYWLGGHDDGWGAHKPGLQALISAVEDAFGRGAGRLDLGPGGQDYKYRLADADDTLEWMTLVPPGRQAVARASLAARRARLETTRRMTPEQRRQVARVLRRG